MTEGSRGSGFRLKCRDCLSGDGVDLFDCLVSVRLLKTGSPGMENVLTRGTPLKIRDIVIALVSVLVVHLDLTLFRGRKKCPRDTFVYVDEHEFAWYPDMCREDRITPLAYRVLRTSPVEVLRMRPSLFTSNFPSRNGTGLQSSLILPPRVGHPILDRITGSVDESFALPLG